MFRIARWLNCWEYHEVMTIQNVRDYLEETMGIPPYFQRMIYAGRDLSQFDNSTFIHQIITRELDEGQDHIFWLMWLRPTDLIDIHTFVICFPEELEKYQEKGRRRGIPFEPIPIRTFTEICRGLNRKGLLKKTLDKF